MKNVLVLLLVNLVGALLLATCVSPSHGTDDIAAIRPNKPDSVQATSSAASNPGWAFFENEQYSLSLAFPPEYLSREVSEPSEPNAVYSVWFMDRELAASETANLQPPMFAVDIYQKSDTLHLTEWVTQSNLIGPGKQFGSG